MKKSRAGKIVKRIVGILLGLVVVGIIAGSFVVGKMVRDGVFEQNKGKDTVENSFKQLEAWGYDADQFLATFKGSDFEVTGKDGVKIFGTSYLTLVESDEYVIITHGAGGDRHSVLPVAEVFLKNGINVITYDQRGSGISEDPNVTFGIREKNDVEALVDYARNDLLAKKLYVLGQSMGGMTVGLYAATDHAKENVDAVILDSPLPGIELTLNYMFTLDDGCDEDTSAYIIWCGKLYCKLFENLDFSDGDTIAQMKNNECKTLVILSKQDEICLPNDVESLYNNIASDDKELVRLDNAHIEGSIAHPEEYEQAIMSFIR